MMFLHVHSSHDNIKKFKICIAATNKQYTYISKYNIILFCINSKSIENVEEKNYSYCGTNIDIKTQFHVICTLPTI